MESPLESNDSSLERWVGDRFAQLDPPEEWQGNPAEARVALDGRRAAVRARRRQWAWAASLAVAGCLGAASFPETRVFAARCVDACLAVLPSRTPVSAPITAGAARREAPDFALTDARGGTANLKDFRGKVVLVNFWATWCHPCRIEIPWFDEFQRTHGDSLVVVGVALDEEGWKPVRSFLAGTNVSYRVTLDEGRICPLFGGVQALPATYLIDKAGRIAVTHAGLVSKSTYEAEIRGLLAER